MPSPAAHVDCPRSAPRMERGESGAVRSNGRHAHRHGRMARVEWVTGRARDRSADRIAAAHKRVAGRHHPARRVGVPRQTRESADHPPAVVGVRLGRFRRHFIPPAAVLAAEGPDVRLEGAHPVGDDVGVPLGGSEQRSAVEALRALSMTGDAARSGLSSGYSRANSRRSHPSPEPSRIPGHGGTKTPCESSAALGARANQRASIPPTAAHAAASLADFPVYGAGRNSFDPQFKAPGPSALTSQAYKTTQTARIACPQTAGRPIPPSKRLRLASEKTSARPPVSKPCLSLWTRWRSGLRPGDNPVYDTEGQK